MKTQQFDFVMRIENDVIFEVVIYQDDRKASSRPLNRVAFLQSNLSASKISGFLQSSISDCSNSYIGSPVSLYFLCLYSCQHQANMQFLMQEPGEES